MWTLWLGLAALLAVQAWWMITRQLAVPRQRPPPVAAGGPGPPAAGRPLPPARPPAPRPEGPRLCRAARGPRRPPPPSRPRALGDARRDRHRHALREGRADRAALRPP